MGSFGYISIASMEELEEKYAILKLFGKRLREFAIPRMPGYVTSTIRDMGIPGYKVSGLRIHIPSSVEGNLGLKPTLERTIKRFINKKRDILIADPSLGMDFRENDLNIRISWGMLFPPFAFMDAVKSVSALMGIDFNRSNICIADASTELGTIVTELLTGEAAYLTLCTLKKSEVMKKIEKHIIKCGISPAVVSNFRKAVSGCDILIYTGNADMRQLTSFINKKVLLVNFVSENMILEKDLLAIDEVILRGQKEPDIQGTDRSVEMLLTSRIWEGALLSIQDMDTKMPSAAKSMEMGKLAKSIGVSMQAAVRNGKTLDRETIYRYR